MLSFSGMYRKEGSSTSPHLQIFQTMAQPSGLGSPFPLLRDLKPEERGLCLIHLLVSCTSYIAADSIENANMSLDQISHLISPEGDTMQRIAAYFTEALANRMLKRWPGLHKALNSTNIISNTEEVLVRRLFLELCPFLKVAYVVTNQAILEAMEGEKMIHIINFGSFEPSQWINLLHLLSTRKEGPPHLRVTGIHEQKEVLEEMSLRLTEEAEKLDIPFQFNPVVSKLENINLDSLRVKTGEALAITFVLQLHSLLAVEDDLYRTNPGSESMILYINHMQRALQENRCNLGERPDQQLTEICSLSSDAASAASSPCLAKITSFLTFLWGLSPKLMVITEQETNNNSPVLMERVTEALNFYAALFDCLESTMPRESTERLRIEKMLFGKEIRNIIECEGVERKERHEKLGAWIPRLELAGFSKVPLSYQGMLQARRLLQSHRYDGYKVKEENGCFFSCWQDRPLFSVSAWKVRRYDIPE